MDGNFLTTFLPLILLAVVFYLLIMRPAKTRQRKQAEMVAAAQPGTDIMTTAGIFGTIVERSDDRIHVQVAPGVVLQLVPAAIAQVIPPPVEAPADPSDQPSA
jgi:preprotein translocase subunit YajC